MKDLLVKVRKHRFISSFMGFYQSAELEFTSIAVAYYLMISVFPLLLIAATILPYLHLDVTDLLGILKTILPDSLYDMAADVVKQVFSQPSSGLLSLSILSAFWTFSNSMNLLQKAFNKAYGVEQGRGLIWERLLSFLMGLGLQLMIGFSFFLALFGRTLIELLHHFWNFNQDLYQLLHDQTEPWIYLTLFATLSLLYFFLPNVKINKIRYVLPGAGFVMIIFLSLSNLFSMYISHSLAKMNDFRVLGSLVLLAALLWFIFLARLLIIGAVLNASYQAYDEPHFQMRKGEVLDMLEDDMEKTQELTGEN